MTWFTIKCERCGSENSPKKPFLYVYKIEGDKRLIAEIKCNRCRNEEIVYGIVNPTKFSYIINATV